MDNHYKFLRTEQKQMCLSIYGIKLWNSLNDVIKECKKAYRHSKLKIVNKNCLIFIF